MKTRLAAGLLLLMSVSTPADVSAIDSAGVMFSRDQNNCAEFLQAYTDEQSARARYGQPRNDMLYSINYQRFVFFYNGFSTGVNAFREGLQDYFYDRSIAMELLKQHCEKNVEDSFVTALMKIMKSPPESD